MEPAYNYKNVAFDLDDQDDFSDVFDFDEELFDNQEEEKERVKEEEFYRPLRDY